MSTTTPNHYAVTSNNGGVNTDTINVTNEGHSNSHNITGGSNANEDEINSASANVAPRRSSIVNGQVADEETARRASLDNLEQRRKSSLSSTPGPFNAPTTDDVSKSEIPPSSSIGTQNAPGKAGEIGEKVMGALGYGGTKVERHPEDQGVAEKIMNLLGA